MFSIFKSEQAKLRDLAKNWLYMAGKVYHFRKDRLSDSDLQRLIQLSEAVKVESRSRKGDAGRLRSAIEALKEHMEQVGGNYYPRGGMAENVEFFFAAIIIYLGVTTFFVKPFKIPTNSMWPTYYGMTGQVYRGEKDAPGAVEKAFRFAAFGATSYEIKAPADGEVMVPVYQVGNGVEPYYQPSSVKRYFVIPTPGRKYTFYVGGKEVSYKVPEDFKIESQVIPKLERIGASNPYSDLGEKFYSGEVAAGKDFEAKVMLGRALAPTSGGGEPRVVGVWRNRMVKLVKTGIFVRKGDPIVNFDLLTGDQLFVDRMSYHFVSPKVGDGFVFKTADIPELHDDKFFIKRLCGTPGDTARIADHRLYVNGKPATGSVTFEKNAKQEGLYAGYEAIEVVGGRGREIPEETIHVPDHSYLALGDNSRNSYDGRYWGFVPERAVIGRPIMIYYPFTKRFGLSK